MALCADVPSSFGAFMQLSMKQRQPHVVVRLCKLQSQHPSLISWHPQLLWNTITFLLSQCDGDCHSHFVATAIPLVELATRKNVYPRLTDIKHPRHGLLWLWDFMTQAEVFTLLCVYLQSVMRQLGSSQPSLGFKIMASRCPPDVQSQLPVFSVSADEFVQRVECALVDNLLLSPADFRRTGTNEWWVVIDDVATVVQLLPLDVSTGSSVSKPLGSSVSKPAASSNQRRPVATDSSRSSSISSSSDSRATPRRKVLLATPSPAQTTSVEKMHQHSNMVSRPVPLTTSVSLTPTSMPRADRRLSVGAVPVNPVSPHVHHQLPYKSQSTAASVPHFAMPPPSLRWHNSAMPTSVAQYSVSNSDYQPSAPLRARASRQSLPSPAGPVHMMVPTGYSSLLRASGPAMPSTVSATVPSGQTLSASVAVTSSMFTYYSSTDPLPVTVSASFPPTRDISYNIQQPSLEPFPTWVAPPTAPCRMTTAGRFV